VCRTQLIRLRGKGCRNSLTVCRKHKAEGYEGLPKILSVDVVGLRQGRHFQILEKLRDFDTVQIAEPTIQQLEAEDADATVVDGDGLGAGCVDHLNHRGYGKRLL